MTRARDWLCISRHDRVTKQSVAPSPYFNELRAHHIAVDDVVIPTIDAASSGDETTIELSYSELASYLDCAMAFRLRTRMGFQPRLAPELGYGKAVHHVMRMIADHTGAHRRVPTATEIDAILDRSFFLPTANKVVHGELKRAARRLVNTYVEQHADDLYRVWETERPFELHLDGITLAGRADVILDHEGGVATSLAIVDYKTSIRGKDPNRDLQLRVYTDAGRREGLDVRAAYIHDMKLDNREAVDISAADVDSAAQHVLDAAERLRQHNFEATPGPRCRTCEVRAVCASSPR